jgi:hypothetical protein
MYKKWLNIFKNLHLYTIFLAKTFQKKKTRALYHACVPRYFAAKVHTFLKNGLYFWRPLYIAVYTECTEPWVDFLCEVLQLLIWWESQQILFAG